MDERRKNYPLDRNLTRMRAFNKLDFFTVSSYGLLVIKGEPQKNFLG